MSPASADEYLPPLTKMLELPDVLVHIDQLLVCARAIQGVFKSLSEAETFVARLRNLQAALTKSNTAAPAFALIASASFRGLEGESLRVTFAKFARQISQVSKRSGSHFILHKPAGRNLSAAEIQCYFDGEPFSRRPQIVETTHRSVADVQRLRPIEPLVAALRGSELEQIASGISDQDSRGRVRVKFFVSYSRKDIAQVERLLEKLRLDLRNSKRFAFEFWQDTQIELGADWHESIREALRTCDLGLAFISPAFLVNDFITKHELPALINGEKPLVPVEIERLDYVRHDLRGLEERQVFKMEESGRRRCFAECTGQVASRFVQALASRLEERVEASLRARAQHHVLSALGDQVQFERLATEFPRLRELMDESLGAMAIEAIGAAPTSAVSPTPREASRREKLRTILDRQVPPSKLKSLIETTCAAMGLDEVERMLEKSVDTSGQTDPYQGFRTHQRKAVDFLRDWLRDPKQPPFAAVLGETGSGKTTMLQMLAHAIASDSSAPPVIFVDLRDYQKSDDATLEGILTEHLRRHGGETGLKPDDLLHAVRREGALIIFDGLDEKIIPLSEGARQAFVRELWRVLPSDIINRPAAQGRGRLVISCRSHYFPTVQAQSSGYLGQDRSSISARDYVACVMLPWQKEQIVEYLAGVLGHDRVLVALEVIATVHNLGDLAQRPYLLSLITPELESLEKDRAAGRSVNAAALYTKFTERWLHRDDGKHVFTHEHKRLLMEQLAADLWRENAREWPWERVTSWLDQFLHDHPVLAGRYARDRISANALNQDFRTATFFLRPDASNNAFRFAHTSLQEYFLATHLARSLATTEAAPAWDLPKPSFETFDFVGQLLATMSLADRGRALSGLRALLEDAESPARARLTAFAFLVRAAKQSLPIPSTVAMQAQGLDLTGWEIDGAVGNQLRLAKASFCGAMLIQTKFRYVELPSSRWAGADLRNAEFIGCGLENADFAGTDDLRPLLEGTHFRECQLAGATVSDTLHAGLRVDHATWDGATQSKWYAALCPRLSYVEPLPPLDPFPVPPDARWSLGHAAAVDAAAFSHDGQSFLTASQDGTVRVWDTRSGACLQIIVGDARSFRAVAFSSDGGRILCASNDGTVWIWDATSGASLQVLENLLEASDTMAFSSDGHWIVSGSRDGTVKVWDVQCGACFRVLEAETEKKFTARRIGKLLPSGNIACSSDGQRVASGFNGSVRIWDIESSECIRVLEVVADVSTEEKMDRVIPRYISTGRIQQVVNFSLAISPDGQYVACAFGSIVKIWDISNGVCIHELQGQLSGPKVTFSADGQHVLSQARGHIEIWDAHNGRCLGNTEVDARMMVLSGDGQRIVSGSSEGVVAVWSGQSGQCLFSAGRHSSLVFRVAQSTDGQRLLTWSLENTIRAWNAESGRVEAVTEQDEQWLKQHGKLVDGHFAITRLGTARFQCPDGTELDIATLPDGGYAVLKRVAQSPDDRWRLVYGSEECWRFVNYATNDERGPALWSADALGPIPLR